MKLAESLLLAMSKPSNNSDIKLTIENALQPLINCFGHTLLEHIKDKVILDCGCGPGQIAIALALHGAAHVTGIDISKKWISQAIQLAAQHEASNKVSFFRGDIINLPLPDKSFDVIITIDTFEHFADPFFVLKKCMDLLKSGGKMYITFGPPWLHPYGVHMRFFIKVPWTHLIFSERTIMNVRKCFRDDGATRYSEVEGGLNKMTVKRFIRMVQKTQFKMERLELCAIKRLNLLVKIPFIREFFTSQVVCILTKE